MPLKIVFWIASGIALILPGAALAVSQSIYATAPVDARAITVRGVGDGRADDTVALQRAIDAADANGAGGIVFLPAGRYRITRTILVWPGVRIFGTGATRPVITLAPSTPGFQTDVANLVFFTGNRPGGSAAASTGVALVAGRVPVPVRTAVPFDARLTDANSGTFYSALSNVDFEIGEGNPAATAVRFHAAQHAYLSHIDFRLGSALAGIYQAGNVGRALRFEGGRYGILAEKTSAAWPFALLDSTFEGQRDAAIREHELGLTLINTTIRNVPVGIEIDRSYGDWLWGKNVRFENVAQAGIVISNEDNVYTQVGLENATSSATPVLARFRDTGRTVAAPGARYRVGTFSHGVTLGASGTTGQIATRVDATAAAVLPKPVAPAIRALPPTAQWVNVRTLGARGDATTDDTAVIQRAIDRHRVLYFPSGFYSVSNTLRLRSDSVLIGLHPDTTQIVLREHSPAFRGVGGPVALMETRRGGDATVSGLELTTGGRNPRATALLWRAGATSLVDDVKFQGGHGTSLPDGKRFNPYNANHTSDADPLRRWDGQYASPWVTDGGGGTFNNIWTPSTHAQAGMYVSNTATPGHVYQISAEHHVRAEIVLDGVRGWEFLAPQTEEEAGEGREAIALEVRNSHDILFANLHAYRVTRSLQPAPAAVRVYNLSGVRFRNVHVNAESGFAACDAEGCGTYLRASKFAYDNAVEDVTRGRIVREREFAVLDIGGDTPAPAPTAVRKLAGGFGALGGAAVDASGGVYFIDRARHRIHRWSPGEGISTVSDAPLDPVNLAVARSGHLMVLSSAGPQGSVYSIAPGIDGAVTPIAPTALAPPRRDARTLLPVSFWNNVEFRDQLDPATMRFTTLAEMFARDVARPRPLQYVSLDRSLVLPAYRVWQQGPGDHLGWRFSDTIDTFGLLAVKPGERVFVANASEARTYAAIAGPGGSLTDLKPFADRGGEGVAVGPDGRVYLANGEVFVFDAGGREVGRIDVPERPVQLVFGGVGGQTLFILTHHSLYAVEPETRR